MKTGRRLSPEHHRLEPSILDFQTCEKSISVISKLPSLWYFVRAALRYKDKNEQDINTHIRMKCVWKYHSQVLSNQVSVSSWLSLSKDRTPPLWSQGVRSTTGEIQNWELLPAHLCDPSPGSAGQRPSAPLSLFYTEITLFYTAVSRTEVVQFMTFSNN